VAIDQPSWESEFLRLRPFVERTARYAGRRFGVRQADIDDLVSSAFTHLIEQDYRVLRSFRSRSKIETYLATVITNFARDYKNSVLGKWRPSMEATMLGTEAVLVEELHIRDGYTLDATWEMLTTNYDLAISRDALERLASRLRPRTTRRFEPEAALESIPTSDRPPDRALLQRERDEAAARLRDVISQIKAALSAEDQVILAMRYEDDVKVVDIAQALGIEVRRLYRRIDTLRGQLRTALEVRGLDVSVLENFEEAP
jgi:RNA polymerase sigma factor (sigma-70 family)